MLANESETYSLSESIRAIARQKPLPPAPQPIYTPTINATPERDIFAKTIGVFDSSRSTNTAGSMSYEFQYPGPNIAGFKFTGATIFNNAVPNNFTYCYLTCDLVRGGYPTYMNGLGSSILAMIPLNTPGPTNFYNVEYPTIVFGSYPTKDIKFELRDQNNLIIKNIPFVVTLTFLISK